MTSSGLQIFLIDGCDNFVKRDGIFFAGYSSGKNRTFSTFDTFQKNTMKGRTGCFCFQTSFFAAMADDLIVVCIDVTELSRETGFSCVDFAIDNNSDADSPADVDENNIFFSFYTPLHILSVSHGTGVVVDGYFMTQPPTGVPQN